MKILIIINEYPPMVGGAGRFAKAFAEEFARDNEVTVITAETEKKIPAPEHRNLRILPVNAAFRKNPEKSNSINRVLMPFVFIFQAIAAGRRHLRTNRYDIIWSVFSVPSGVAGVALAKRYKIPHAVTTIGTDVYEPTKWYSPHRNPVYGAMVKYVLKNSQLITSISSDIKRKTEMFFRPRQKVITAHIGFEPSKFSKADREELGLRKDETYLIYVNRIVRRKGHEHLIKALKKIRNGVRLLIVGEGPERQRLQRLAEKIGVSDRIIWTGYVSEKKKWQYLAASDIYVSPSLHEGFGINIVEAMSVGLPVVSTNRGGQTDFLKDGENAVLVNPARPKELADAVNLLLNDRNLAKRLALANLKSSEELKTSSCARKYLELFENLVRSRKKERK